MRACKLHPYELGVGVCASCLRERLLALLAAHPELSADHRRSRRKYDPTPPPPPPILFPRSVSPYLSHRRSLDSEPPRHLLFYSTPQVGPTFDDARPSADRPRRRDRFPLLKSLFGNPRSGGADPDSSSSKASWLSTLLRRRGRRMKPRTDEPSSQPCRANDHGMPPAIQDYDDDGSVSDSGYSTESSSGAWRHPGPTPLRRPSSAARQYRQGSVSGFVMCLSPLVRAGPGRQRRCQPADTAFSGDLRRTPHRHTSVGAASLGPNRSRKLVDFGRSR